MANKTFFNKKTEIPAASAAALGDCLAFIEGALGELGTDRKLILRAVLTAEELIAQFIESADEGASLRLQVKKLLGDVSISISVRGRELDLLESYGGDLAHAGDAEAQQAIRSILLKAQSDRLKVTHRRGVNNARILVGQAQKSMAAWTVGALICGILFGLAMKFLLPASFSLGVSTYLLNPVKTMFMNALKIVIAPVVFFSIVSCIAQFKDLAELGRIAAKVMGIYLLTTVIAVALSLGTFALLHPGDFGFALSQGITEAVDVDMSTDTSLLSTLVNIVPSNFLRPFLESDTLQIIFLGVLCGVAIGMVGKYAPLLQDFFEACNSLFLTITTIISRVIPLAVFASTAIMVNDLGGGSLLGVLGLFGTYLVTIVSMLAIYGLLILVFGRLNPLTFFKKNREGMLTSFTLSSSSASMPTNMRVCTDRLGVSPKVSSFSIPLGATVNMDGTCILLTLSGLFLARAYGVAVPVSAMTSLAITIILLSLGCPGVPGAAFVCIAVVLENLHVPIEAMGLLMGIYPIIDMIGTMSNTTGDVACTTIVAKSENLLDMQVYNS